jgi:hypothetical protein
MVQKSLVSLPKLRRLFFTFLILNNVCQALTAADLNQRNLEGEPILIRKERSWNTNSFASSAASAMQNILLINSASNTTTVVLTEQFWTNVFGILQYCTFFSWFALLFASYVGGVCVLYLFQIVSSPYGSSHGSHGGGDYNYNSLFRSFEDENMPLFDKVTSVGYGFLDRTSELATLVQTPECLRYAICHMSSQLGDQEANGFVFKDLLRSISSQLDTKAGAEGMTRSVNVGLLTGECDEPIMSCPELVPYFKKVADTWSNYL